LYVAVIQHIFGFLLQVDKQYGIDKSEDEVFDAHYTHHLSAEELMKCISENEYVTVEDDKSKDLYVLWSWVGNAYKKIEDRFSYAHPYR